MVIETERNPSFKLRIRDVFALIVVIALGMAMWLQEAAYQSTIVGLENKLRLERRKQLFGNFMKTTFGELGTLVMKEPQEVMLFMLAGGGVGGGKRAPNYRQSWIS